MLSKRLFVIFGLVLASGCAVEASDGTERIGRESEAFSVAGCFCPQTGSCSSISYADKPSDGIYYVTTFTGGGMACGGVADGTWPYVADSARFGCGAKLLVEGGGKACVVQVADCGPNRCVEQAASYSSCAGHFPILDVSPMITKYLFGVSGSGWSDKRAVKVTPVPSSTPIGCPGGCKVHCDGSTIVGGDCGRGDCAAFGAKCVDDSLGVRCASVFCPSIGEKKVCLPDGHTIGTCKNGAIETGDCGAFGAVCREDGGAHCVPPYDAALVGKGSNALPDAAKKGEYRVCAGHEVKSWFELRNTGHLAWSGEGASGTRPPGKAIRLGTSDPTRGTDFPDPFTGEGRVSIATSSNPDVHFDGPDCKTKGCSRTRFEIVGKAPAKPGDYVTSYRLVDELHTWFGPTMSLAYHVVECPPDPSADPVAPTSDLPEEDPSAKPAATSSEDTALHGTACVMGHSPGESSGLLALLMLATFVSRRFASRTCVRGRADSGVRCLRAPTRARDCHPSAASSAADIRARTPRSTTASPL